MAKYITLDGLGTFLSKLKDGSYKASTSEFGAFKAAGVRSSAINSTTGETTSSRYYGVEMDSNGKAFVNVPWTDTNTKVTSADNHYAPTENTSSALSAAGGTLTDIANSSSGVQVVTGLKRDAKGHVVGVNSVALKSTNSTYTLPNCFKTIDCPRGSDLVADSTADTLTLADDGYITVTGDSTNDKITFAHATPTANTGSTLTATASGASAAWSIDVVKGVSLQRDAKGHVTGVTVTSGKLPANPNTDTKVTSVDNHYAPTENTGSALSANASGATAAWSIDVVKGVTIKRDAKGHVTGVAVTSGKLPANPNTNTAHKHAVGVGLTCDNTTGTTSGTVTYALKTAGTGEIGGVKIAGTRSSTITTTQGGSAGSYYGVEIDSNGKAFVNVPTPPTGSTDTYGVLKVKTGDLSDITSNADSIAASYYHNHDKKYAESGHTHSDASETSKGFVKLVNSDLQNSTHVNGEAAGLGHTHGQYATASNFNTHSGTTGATGTTGHVKLVTGDLNNKSYAKGEAAAAAHTHSNYSVTDHKHVSADITDSISASSGITSTASGLTQGKAVYNYAAKKSHASTTNTYGLGTTANYGHVKISNGDVSTVASVDGLVAGMDHSHGNYSLTSHTHGTITLSGDVTGSASIGSGTTAINITTTVTDDSHNHTKLGTSTVGASNKPIYLNAGVPTAIDSIGEAFLSWGGKSISGSISPLDAALDGSFSANRLSFINPSAITIQYRTDGVNTTDDSGWIDYGLTNAQKQSLVTTGLEQSINPGKKGSGTTVSDRVRVIIDGNAGGIYFSLRKVLFYVCTNGVSNISCDIHIHNNGTNAWSKIGTYNLTGWSGWNSIGLGNYPFGASSGSFVSQKIMFIFYCNSVNGLSSGLAPNISKISMHGETAWIATGMAANGHMYTWDVSKNVTFPGDILPSSDNAKNLGSSSLKWDNVYATTFNGNATSATKATQDGNGRTITTTYAPISHASTTNTYGLGTTANYGHVKISNGDVSTVASVDGLVAGMDHSHSKTRISTTATNAYMPMLFVNATTSGDTAILIDSSTGTGSTSSGIRYNPSGNTCYCSGGFFEASDERLKNFSENIDVDLDKLAQLPKKYFTWKDDKNGKVHIGTSAQELQKIYPELVDTLEDGTLIVSYDTLSIIALKGVDVLYEKYKSLEERLNKLEKMLE